MLVPPPVPAAEPAVWQEGAARPCNGGQPEPAQRATRRQRAALNGETAQTRSRQTAACRSN
eukprot:4808368-Alexandrium_andersonii.AAC.1